MYENISSQCKAERTTFETPIILPSGIEHDFFKTVKMIAYHDAGMFFENDDLSDIFWPLGQKRKPHFIKKLDTDSKDYEVTPEGDSNVYAGWLANIKLRSWFRDSGFSMDLNDIYDNTATNGSSIAKLTPNPDGTDDLKPCNLLYMWFDRSIKELKGQTKIELHMKTEAEIRAMPWKDLDKAIENAEVMDNQEVETTAPDRNTVVKYKIWQRVGEFKNANDKVAKFYNTIFCGYGESEVILFQEVIKPEDDPYVDFHLSGYKDRWLRIGIYERLFGLQRLVNEVVNYDRESQAISSLLLLQSKDKALVGRSVLEEAFSGMILDTSGLSQVAIDNRGAVEVINKINRLEVKADELCMTPDVITGEKLPSGATYHGQALLTNIANDAFKDPRDRIGFAIAEFILKKKLPRLMAKWNTEDVLEIAGDEEHASKFDSYAKRYIKSDWISTYWRDNDANPSMAEQDAFDQRLEQEWKLRPRRQQLKGIFKGYKYGLTLNPTGENVNKEQRNEVFDGALQQLVQVSPTAFITLLKKKLEFNGISGVDIPIEEVQNAMAAKNNSGQGQYQDVAQPQDNLASMVTT